MKVLVILLCFLCFFAANSSAQISWQANLDGKIRFYQTTDFGVLLAGTDNSIYAIDGENGQRLWRRGHRGLNETSLTQVPGTDLVLLSLYDDKKSRLEAIDLLTGNSIWRSDKIKGDAMQLAVEPAQDLLAVVLVKKAVGKVGEEFKRSPQIHVLRLSDGEELWSKELDSDVEMMPAQFGENVGEVPHTLDNYRAPMILDGKLYLFYEGVSAYEARTGKEFMREEFGVNEDDLALTDADPVFDEKNVYISGRGKIRAVDRNSGKIIWKADDLGETPEMAVIGEVLYVRTGGQFTNIRTGEVEKNGPFGVSAIDTKTGKKIWRFKGADKGLTNFVFADLYTIVIADKDDLILINAKDGKRKSKFEHDVDDAQFVLINERREAVVGGKDEIAAFQISNSAALKIKEKIYPQINTDEHGYSDKFQKVNFKDQKSNFKSENKSQISKIKDQNEREVWRVKHKAPSRGVLRTIAGIALRATALYFRYGGLATSALNLYRGASFARSVLSLRWSGLKTRFSVFDLTTLASNSAKNYVSDKIYIFGSLARNPNILNPNLPIGTNSNVIRGKITGKIVGAITPSGDDVRESLLEKLDPVRQVERLSDYFLKRKRLSEFRGNFMYFYTDLPKPYDRKGLIGVNVHTGRDARFIAVSEPDARFTTDEPLGLLYSADGSNLKAFNVLSR